MLRISNFFMIGWVCAFGGAFVMILMILFCVRMSGCMYVLLFNYVPQMLMDPIRWGYTSE